MTLSAVSSSVSELHSPEHAGDVSCLRYIPPLIGGRVLTQGPAGFRPIRKAFIVFNVAAEWYLHPPRQKQHLSAT
jgi:hypothetical protein